MEKTALMFSGGKDSMACLYLYKEHLNEITVIWCNTGKNYPEAVATIGKARKMCPNWIEINVDRDLQWANNGLPSDLVPVDFTNFGQSVTSKKPFAIQSYLQCHLENITKPIWDTVILLGFTKIIRGQRKDDEHHATSHNGDTEDGVTFIHPIEDWTKEQVLAFLKEEMGELPEHYQLEHSSMDCYDCTGFTKHSPDRVAYTKKRHPELYADYRKKLEAVAAAISVPLREYRTLLEV